MRIYSNKKRPVKASDGGRKWVNTEVTKAEWDKLRKFLKANGYKFEPSEAGSMVHVECYLNDAEIKKVNDFIDTLDDVKSACGKKSVKSSTRRRSVKASYGGNVSASKIQKFIEDSIADLQNSDATNCRLVLDNDLCLYVGYSDGFDTEDGYGICAKIAERNDADWADFDYLNMPWNTYDDNDGSTGVFKGDVYDTEVEIIPGEDYTQDAQWLAGSYVEIRNLLDNGELTFSDIEASTKSRRKAVKSSMSHKRRYIKSDIDIWDDLGFSDFDDIDWAELFGLESEEVFYDSVRQYLGMNPDDDVEFVDIVEYVNNHPKYYNMLKEAYYNGFDGIGASTRRRSVKASNNIQSQFDMRTQFQTFLSKVDREVSNSLYGYDDARWDVKGTMSVDSEGYWFELNLWCDNKEAGTVNISVDTNSNYRTATAAYVVTVLETDEVQAEGKSFDDVYETCVGELIRLAEDYVNFVRDDRY